LPLSSFFLGNGITSKLGVDIDGRENYEPYEFSQTHHLIHALLVTLMMETMYLFGQGGPLQEDLKHYSHGS
jgi:hypothetical protein